MAVIDYTCVCGKQMRFKPEHAGKKTKCPDCNATITVPGSDDDVEDYEDEEEPVATGKTHSSGMSVTGKRAVVSLGGAIVPSMFGTTTLEIEGSRLIEETRGIVSHRHAELLLGEVDSAELVVKPNPAVLGASIALIPVFGVGLLLLPFYFIMKYKFLIIHSGNNATVVAIKGSEDPFHDFMDNVLTLAAKAKRH